MSLRVPNTLTTANSDKYKVSIRLRPDGLSFLGAIPSERETFFYESTRLDRTKSYAQALKEVFFEHSFFTYPYKEVSVVCTNRQYTLVPEVVFDESKKEQVMNFTFGVPKEKTMHHPLKELDAVLLFGIDLEVYEFFSRSLVNTRFIHAMSPLLLYWRKLNQTVYPKQLYVSIHEDTMDAACFDKGTLLFVNSFYVEEQADVIYYVLYIWKQLGLDQMKDRLVLSADPVLCSNLRATLQNYVLQTEELNKSPFDTDTPLPVDVTALFACES